MVFPPPGMGKAAASALAYGFMDLEGFELWGLGGDEIVEAGDARGDALLFGNAKAFNLKKINARLRHLLRGHLLRRYLLRRYLLRGHLLRGYLLRGGYDRSWGCDVVGLTGSDLSSAH